MLLAGLVTVAAACEPCAGVSGCTSGPQLSLEGSLVSHLNGQVQAGVRVDVIRTGGVGLDPDSSSTTTDRNGHWQLSARATSPGEVVVAIAIHPREFDGYRVADQHFQVKERRGDGYILPTWVVDPHYPYTAELYYRGPTDIRVANAPITFVRRSGVSLYLSTGVVTNFYGGKTDGAGRIVLFDVGAHGVTLGQTTGDLVVSLPSPFVDDTVHGVTLSNVYLLHQPVSVLRYGVGPSLLYAGGVTERRNGRPAAGLSVAFHRTSGIQTDPVSFSTTTDAAGRFLFPLRALGEGSVTGDLEITPSLGSPVTVKNVLLRPHHDDGVPFFGVWAVGPALPWVALVQIGGHGVAGVTADFHRTGGIAVTPSDYTTTSNSDGYLQLNPQPQAVGTVEADVTVHGPAPFGDVKFHVRLNTVENDVDGGVIAQFNLDRPATASSAPSRSSRQSAGRVR